MSEELLGERELSKLKWRCRRGLLENDLLIERFFLHHEATLTVSQAKGLDDLMALSDNDLLDLLLRRKEPNQLSAASHPNPCCPMSRSAQNRCGNDQTNAPKLFRCCIPDKAKTSSAL